MTLKKEQKTFFMGLGLGIFGLLIVYSILAVTGIIEQKKTSCELEEDVIDTLVIYPDQISKNHYDVVYETGYVTVTFGNNSSMMIPDEEWRKLLEMERTRNEGRYNSRVSG